MIHFGTSSEAIGTALAAQPELLKYASTAVHVQRPGGTAELPLGAQFQHSYFDPGLSPLLLGREREPPCEGTPSVGAADHADAQRPFPPSGPLVACSSWCVLPMRRVKTSMPAPVGASPRMARRACNDVDIGLVR